MLTAGPRSSGVDRPPELLAGDLDTPLGQALTWLNQNLVMDVTERVSKVSTGGVGLGEPERQADDDLWQRLEREQLARDPRASIYRRIWTRSLLSETDPMIELTDILCARLPKDCHGGRASDSLLRHILDSEPGANNQMDVPHHRWRLPARIRVRALRVLRRWADAQTDERLIWLDPLAPASNLAMITAALAQLQMQRAYDDQGVELTEDDLDDLWLYWLRQFVGSGKAEGWFNRLGSADLEFALQRLPEWMPEVSTALCWLAVRPGIDRALIIEWQPVIASALEYNLIDTTEVAARYISAVTRKPVSADQVDGRLVEVREFIDDALWCAQTSAELELDGLELKEPPQTELLQLRLDVRGIVDPMLDSRVPRLITAARSYRHCDGIALYAADTTWRVVVSTGNKIAYIPSLGLRAVIESSASISEDTLERLTSSGGVLATLFPDTAIVR